MSIFGVAHSAFSLPTMASPALQGAPKNGFGEAVVACDMPEACKFPSLQKSLEDVPVNPRRSLPCSAPTRHSGTDLLEDSFPQRRTKHKLSDHMYTSDSLLMSQVILCWKRIGENEIEWTGKAEITKAEFLEDVICQI